MKIQAKLSVVPVLTAVIAIGMSVHLGVANESAQQSSQDNLYKVGFAMLQYSDDYDGKLPQMQDAATAEKSFYGFVEEAALVQPETKTPYVPNPALSEQKLADFNGKNVVAFYEAQPDKDGKRWVLFAPPFDQKIVHFENNSGFVKDYVKRLDQSEWLKVKPSSAKQ